MVTNTSFAGSRRKGVTEGEATGKRGETGTGPVMLWGQPLPGFRGRPGERNVDSNPRALAVH